MSFMVKSKLFLNYNIVKLCIVFFAFKKTIFFLNYLNFILILIKYLIINLFKFQLIY